MAKVVFPDLSLSTLEDDPVVTKHFKILHDRYGIVSTSQNQALKIYLLQKFKLDNELRSSCDAYILLHEVFSCTPLIQQKL